MKIPLPLKLGFIAGLAIAAQTVTQAQAPPVRCQLECDPGLVRVYDPQGKPGFISCREDYYGKEPEDNLVKIISADGDREFFWGWAPLWDNSDQGFTILNTSKNIENCGDLNITSALYWPEGVQLPSQISTNTPAIEDPITLPITQDIELPEPITLPLTSDQEPVKVYQNQQSEQAVLDISPDPQDYPLTCEIASAKMAVNSIGVLARNPFTRIIEPVTEELLRQVIPNHPNPHDGFRGAWLGSQSGINCLDPYGDCGYGLYPEILSEKLAELGIASQVEYNMTPEKIKDHILQGHGVLVWFSRWSPFDFPSVDSWYEGEQFRLVPGTHTSIVSGFRKKIDQKTGKETIELRLDDTYPYSSTDQGGGILWMERLPRLEEFIGLEGEGGMSLIITGILDKQTGQTKTLRAPISYSIPTIDAVVAGQLLVKEDQGTGDKTFYGPQPQTWNLGRGQPVEIIGYRYGHPSNIQIEWLDSIDGTRRRGWCEYQAALSSMDGINLTMDYIVDALSTSEWVTLEDTKPVLQEQPTEIMPICVDCNTPTPIPQTTPTPVNLIDTTTYRIYLPSTNAGAVLGQLPETTLPPLGIILKRGRTYQEIKR